MRNLRAPVFCFLLSTFYFLFSFISYAETVRLDRIEMKRDRGYDYLDVYTTGWSEAKGLLLENKLYIDFPGAVVGQPEFLKRKSKRIADIAFEQKDKTTARLVITLKKSVDYDIVNVFGRDKTVIEIGDRLDGGFTRQFAWETKIAGKKGAPLKPVKLAPVVARADLPLRGKTIILDPGHGGDDPGAAGCGSLPEKELTLLTARACAERLREAGAAVILTRDEDRRSNLRDVMSFANGTNADIFISIHYNSTENGRIAGSETYYHNPVSRRFAEAMHEAVVRGVGEKDRGLHRVPFYTVKNARMPSVLLEPAYLSNEEEYERASSASFREKLAGSILKGVKEYFGSRTH